MRRALRFLAVLCLRTLRLAAPGDAACRDIARGKELLGEGDVAEAEQAFEQVLAEKPQDCEALYGLLLARSGALTDFVNRVAYRFDMLALIEQRSHLRELADRVDVLARSVAEKGCVLSLDKLPFSLGAPEAPYARGELRGRWDTAEALFLGAWANIWQYCAAAIDGMAKGIQPAPSILPPELTSFYNRMHLGFVHLFQPSPDRKDAIVGWVDSDGSGSPTEGDRITLRLFEPGGDAEVIDLGEAAFFLGGWRPPKGN